MFANTLAATYDPTVHGINIEFTEWYRYCGTGILEKSDPAMFLQNMELFCWWSLAVEDRKTDNDGYLLK